MVTVITKRPKQLILAFSEIAGMLVILKAAIVIAIAHRLLFNCRMRHKLSDESGRHFTEIYSFDNFKDIANKVKGQEIKLNEQQVMIEDQRVSMQDQMT